MKSLYEIYYSKEIKNILKIYNNILKEYNNLIEYFNFKNIIQIYELFCFSFNNGYLSYDKNFNFNDKTFEKIECLQSVNVILGNAVCRHVTAMFYDILNYRNIENYIVPILTENEDTKLNLIGNHLINLVVQDNYYLLDCINNTIVEKIGEILKSDYYFATLKHNTIINRKYFDSKSIEKNISLPQNDIEENKNIQNTTFIICNDNINIFEKFYKENEENYSEIYTKIKNMI